MSNRHTHKKQASNQTTNEIMNNKQTRQVSKQASKQASKQSDNQTIKNQQSYPFSLHIIYDILPSAFYALNVMEGIYRKFKKEPVKLWRFYWGRRNIDVISSKFVQGSTPGYAEEHSISVPENLTKAHSGLVCNVSPCTTSSVTGEERLAVAEFNLAFNVIIQY
jgi:hypothetical protein